MIYEISYYLFNTVCLGGLFLGVSYVINPEKTQNFMYEASWQITKQSLILKDTIKEMYHEANSNVVVNEPEEKKEHEWNTLIIDENTNSIKNDKYTFDKLINCYDMIKTKYNGERRVYISKMIENKEYWKEIDIKYILDIPKTKQLEYLNDIVTIEKPFIQILLHNDKKSIDINEYLDAFYVNGNQILDITFLKWYLYYYYNITLDNDYKLDIIDSNIKMHELKKYDSVLFTNNTYEINSDAC